MPAMGMWEGEMGSNAKKFLTNLEKAKAAGVAENKLLVEVSGSHTVNCSEKLFIPHISKNRVVSWVFTVTSSPRLGPLCLLKHVFTLDPDLPEYSITNVSAVDKPILTLPHDCQEWQNKLKAQTPEYKVTVQFVSKCYGNFYQRLVFGFGNSPKIIRNLGVMVAPETTLVKQLAYERPSTEENELNWLRKFNLVTYNGKVQKAGSEQSSSKLPPSIKYALEFGSFDYMDDAMTPENYTGRLHTLLHIEEYERRKRMTRLNLNCEDILQSTSTSEEHILRSCIELPINSDVLEDANHLISRSSFAIVKLVPPRELVTAKERGKRNPKLYEVIVVALKKHSIVFLTSNELHKLLQQAKSPLPASVCFRFVNTYKYMHRAIDNINLECVFPSNPNGLSLEFDALSHHLLNKPQATALNHILDPRPKPPLLIFGPFGTGKTRTLAEAVKELCRLHSGNPDENLRILICTHSNSAADHYIVNYLHPFITSRELGSDLCTPLRICWEDRFLKTVSHTVLNYCLINQETGKFAVPTKSNLDRHRVIVTTLVTADVLSGAGLPPGYFSHIFIDEAAQAMEAETLIPLCLSTPLTRVVLAGDHLQLGAIVNSTVARRLSLDRSLLVRLYEYYPPTSNCKLLLLENYRAYQEIVDIPSKLFYEGTLIAHKVKPATSGYPVHFYGVLGEEARAPDIPSYYNMAEAAEISERVEELVKKWYEDCDDDSSVEENICVLAPYTAQVREIRQLLRRKGLGQVRVEGVNNVQGLEFDAIFISTVHTSCSMTAETIDRQDMGFLSDPRLLNTAVTRAKYQLVMVGDPNALCGAGDCKVCWKTILSKCNDNDTFHYRLPFDKIVEYSKVANQNVIDNGPSASSNTQAAGPSMVTLRTQGEMQQTPVGGVQIPTPELSTAGYQSMTAQFPFLGTPQVSMNASPNIPIHPMLQSVQPSVFQRPGFVNHGMPSAMFPFRPSLQTVVGPRGQTRLVYSTGQVQIFPGQNGPVVRTVQYNRNPPLSFMAPMFRPGQGLPPRFTDPRVPGQPLPGQVQFVGQQHPGFAVHSPAPHQPSWPGPSPQGVPTSPGGQSPILASKQCPTPTDSSSSRSGSISPLIRGSHSPSVTGPASSPFTSDAHANQSYPSRPNLPHASAPSEQGARSISISHGPPGINGIVSPTELSTEHIIQSIMYNIQCRKQMLSQEESFLVKLASQTTLPKEITDHALKQIQVIKMEKHCNAERSLLHETITTRLSIDCTEATPVSENRRNSLNLEEVMAMKRLSLDSDDEIKQLLLSPSSLEGKRTPSEEFEDSDTEEWFMARREDPLVQEYIKAFESFAESFFLERDKAQSYENITADDFRAGLEHLESSNWVLKPWNNVSYIGSTIHQEYEDEGLVFDKLLKNELVLCTLEVNGVNSGTCKVIASDVKAMHLGSNIDEMKNHEVEMSLDITISSRVDMNRAFHGDIVAVEVYNKVSGKPTGRVVYIVQKVNQREWICNIDIQDSNVMIPIDKNNPNIFVMQSREHRDLKGVSVYTIKEGEARCREFVPLDHAQERLFLVRVLEWGTNYRLPLGIVRKCFKEISDLNSVIPVFAAEHGVRLVQPDEVINEVRNLYPDSFKVPETEWLSRAYRYNNAFTIDCGDSLGMELDDAISIVREKGGTFSVGVHVSDVSYFVRKDSCIDKAAYTQGSSLYPEQHNGSAINMLPPHLSQNLCSLLPRQDRLAVSVIFRMDKDGQVIKPPDIHRSVVYSCCSLTFKECDDILDGKQTRKLPGNLRNDLVTLENLTRKIALRQVRLGCISNTMDLIQNNRSRSSNIVEQLMIMANSTVAQRLLVSARTKHLALLRRQLPPKQQASESLATWCAENSVLAKGSLTLQRLPKTEAPARNSPNEVRVELSNLGHISTAVNAQDLTQLTESLLKCEDSSEKLDAHSRFFSIQQRSQYIVSSHSYGPQVKHFTLGQECYTHFTSPLRRYFDLVVHRCLLALVYDKPFPYSLKELQDICVQCQITSSRANAFEKSCMSISLANSLRTGQQSRTANIERVTADRLTLNCKPDDNCRPFNRNINVQNLGYLTTEFDEHKQELVTTWAKKDIKCSAPTRSQQPPTPKKGDTETSKDNYHVNVPSSSWIAFIQDVTRGNMKKIVRQWKKVNSSSLPVHPSLSATTTGGSKTAKSTDSCTAHFAAGGKLNVVLGSEVRRGLPQPVIRGIQVNPSFFSCISHHHSPELIFCPPLDSCTEFVYQDVQHYQRVMLPLIEAEAAVSSLRSNKTSIQLCGVSLSWKISGRSVHASATIPKGPCEAQDLDLSIGDYLCIQGEMPSPLQTTEGSSPNNPCILLHARIGQLTDHTDRLVLLIEVTEPSNTFSAEAFQGHAHKYTIEVIPQCPKYKWMIEAIKGLSHAPVIIRSIVTCHDLPGTPAKLNAEVLRYFPLDIDQVEAVKSALSSPFTVIYGQPGTGKTWTAVAITCHFINHNWQARAGQVMVCAPNNKALDVIARMLVKIPSVSVLRVYSREDEQQPSLVINECKRLALHLRVRRPENPHSNALRICLDEIEQVKRKLKHSGIAERDNLYKKLVSKKQKLAAILDAAEGYEFTQTSNHVILCTCAESGSPRVMKFTKVSQCIVDECNMCLDAELLVPFVLAGQQCHHMVLIGDPKQLVPVPSKTAVSHGLSRSLFEALVDDRAGKRYECRLLRMQFRMHPSLRVSSSELFYKESYKPVFDAPQVTNSTVPMEGLWPNSQEYRHVFCHVIGEERVDVTGDLGSGRWNPAEVDKVVAVVEYIKSFGFTAEHICIISPYVRQRERIRDALEDQNLQIISPTESQGTEHQFVVFSTVRTSELEYSRKFDSLSDLHQLNVVFTRARLGLIIIGNRNYLNIIPVWKRLLSEYDSSDSIMDGSSWP